MLCRKALLAAGLAVLLLLVAQNALAQQPLATYYSRTDSVLAAHVVDGQVDYGTLANQPAALDRLVAQIERQSLSALPDPHAKAFLLNAYNLLVIDAVVEAYPIDSPQDVPRFFETSRYWVGGTKRSLNGVEDLLFERYRDPRLHFALVCAAKSCPALPDSSFRGDQLDTQLDRITRQTLRNASFVEVDPDANTVRLSKIFDWYTEDFTRSAASLIAYVNQYRRTPIPPGYDVQFRHYDWTLNDRHSSARSSSRRSASSSTNIQRFTPSTLIRPGQFTLKLFNNLYTQTAYFDNSGTRTELGQRSTYFTGIVNTYVGLTPTLNAGFELYVQSVRLDTPESSPFAALSFASRPQSRTAVTSILPKVKWAPPALRGVVLQFGALVPFAADVDGADGGPFLAEGDPQLQIRAFYDTPLSEQFLLYLEGGVASRFDQNAGDPNEWGMPLRTIVNYYPTDRVTLYGLVSTTPAYTRERSTVSSQIGAGAKYQLIPGVQVEALVSTFPLGINAGAGTTYNLGIRLLR